MISCSKSQELIYWDLDLKGDRTIINILEEEHEHVIETVVFVPLLTAKIITKARMDQDDEEEQTGGNVEGEENKDEEEKISEKQTSSETKGHTSTAARLKELREKKAKIMNRAAGKGDKIVEEEEKKEDNLDEIVVKDEFVASGSRDKKIKIWNAKRGN